MKTTKNTKVKVAKNVVTPAPQKSVVVEKEAPKPTLGKGRTMFGITRIEQPSKKNFGYYVRISDQRRTVQKYFPDKSSGGKSKALTLAKAFRDETLNSLSPVARARAASPKRVIPQSGQVGITHVVSQSAKRKYTYWQAAWVGSDGQRRTAKFSISKYGAEGALSKAKAALRKAKRALKAEEKELRK